MEMAPSLRLEIHASTRSSFCMNSLLTVFESECYVPRNRWVVFGGCQESYCFSCLGALQYADFGKIKPGVMKRHARVITRVTQTHKPTRARAKVVEDEGRHV